MVLTTLSTFTKTNTESQIVEYLSRHPETKRLTIKNHTLSQGLWDAIFKCKSLEELSLESCKSSTIPDSIRNLNSLKVLNLKGTDLHSLPEELQSLKKLEKLVLSETSIVSLPRGLDKVSGLRQLNVRGCHQLVPSTLVTLKQRKDLVIINP